MTSDYILYLAHQAAGICGDLDLCLLDGPELINLIHLENLTSAEASMNIRTRCEYLSRELSRSVPKNARISLFSHYCKAPVYSTYLNTLSLEYHRSAAFRRHCRNQVFQNLDPVLRRHGAKNGRHRLTADLSPYLLKELALKLYVGNESLADVEFSPEPEMELTCSIYQNRYPRLAALATRRLHHQVVEPRFEQSGLELRNLSYRYSADKLPGKREERFRLHSVNIRVPSGERFAIIGPSGSGKSTILRLIAGHLPIDSGDLYLAGQSISDLEPGYRRVLTVFQDLALFPHLTVGENVEFPLVIRKLPKAERQARVDEILERFELQEYHDSKPAQLSGGERQRVALARALVAGPSVLLLDEPTSSLDVRQKNKLASFITDLSDYRNPPSIIIVTHDYEFAFSVCHQLAILDGGRVVAQGRAEDLVLHPPNLATARILDNFNIFRGFVNDRRVFRPENKQLNFSVPLPDIYDSFRSSSAALIVRATAILLRPSAGNDEVAIHANFRIAYFRGAYVRYLFDLDEKNVLICDTSSEQRPFFYSRQRIDLAFRVKDIDLVSNA